MQKISASSPVVKSQSAFYDRRYGIDVPDEQFNNSQISKKPIILLTATLRWPIAARLAMSFTNMGCHVEVLCPRQHPATKTRATRRIHPYRVYQPLLALRAAIKAASPDLIIPCDDNAAADLHRLYVLAGNAGSINNPVCDLIARSMGAPEAFALVTARGQLMALAEEEGVRVPSNTVVASPDELNAWFTQHTFPAVIKSDRTWGGQGVSIVQNQEEAQRIFEFMTSPPSKMNAIARTLLERDAAFILNSLKAAQRTLTIQDFIQGSPANRAVACWQGTVLAGISVEVIKAQHSKGPATVMRIIENPEMSEAVIRLVRRLGISGLWGADFMLDASTGAAYLIEINPRATPTCHLPLGVGRNLPAELYSQLTGTLPLAPLARINHDVIALFPGEWHRHPTSPYLHTAYHDIPLGEPALIQDGMDLPWSERGWIARLWARVRPKLSRLPIQKNVPVGANHIVQPAQEKSNPDR